MGMAARYFLSKKGVDVLLVDAFDPPHELGSHNGDTRTIRPRLWRRCPVCPACVKSAGIMV
ncbi:hypothetical protein [Bacillus swezeyi]|uniref:hypothetical protein n=1 Tax=Bacillus swezeyi TaxID=1925020 RepID=UPI00399D1AB9